MRRKVEAWLVEYPSRVCFVTLERRVADHHTKATRYRPRNVVTALVRRDPKAEAVLRAVAEMCHPSMPHQLTDRTRETLLSVVKVKRAFEAYEASRKRKRRAKR